MDVRKILFMNGLIKEASVMNRKNQGNTIKDLGTNDVKNEFDVDEETIEVNEESIGTMESQSILKIVTDVKNYQKKEN